jgi:hypothetical protein
VLQLQLLQQSCSLPRRSCLCCVHMCSLCRRRELAARLGGGSAAREEAPACAQSSAASAPGQLPRWSVGEANQREAPLLINIAALQLHSLTDASSCCVLAVALTVAHLYLQLS